MSLNSAFEQTCGNPCLSESMAQSWRMMAPGHPEHDLWGIVSLALPETWQHAVNHLLDGALAFSGLSLVLGYGVLALALPLVLLPTAFPELSRPRDALWSLVLAVLAPLLLLNRLPVFSSAGFGELIATVLMGRLAAEVGQGRWGALTSDQKSALRHLPRWRRAGSDLVVAVAQAAKTAWAATVQAATAFWSATAQTATAAWKIVSPRKGPVQEERQPGQPARKAVHKPARKQWIRPDPSDEAQVEQDGETSPGSPDTATEVGAGSSPAIGSVPDAESAQPGAGGDGDPVDVPGATAAPVDAELEAPEIVEDHAEPPEAEPLLEPVVPPSEGAVVDVGGAEQEGEAESGEIAPEEPGAPEPVEEESQEEQPVAAGDPVDVPGAAAAPVDAAPEAPEVVEDDAGPPEAEPLLEPMVPPSEGTAGDVGGAAQEGEAESGEIAPEEPGAPEPVEEESQEEQPVAAGDPVDVPGVAAVPVDATLEAPEIVEDHAGPPEAEPLLEPVVPPSEGAVVDVGGAEQEGEAESGEIAPEEPGAPEPVEEESQEEQPVAAGDPVDVPGAAAAPVDAAPEAPEVVEDDAGPPEAEPLLEPMVPPSEGAVVDVGGAEQEAVDVSETDPAQPAGDDSAKPAQEGEDVVARSFDDVDKKLGGSG